MKFNEKVQKIRDAMNKVIFEREDVVNACAVAMVSEKNIFMLGPAGCAKSMIPRTFVSCFSDNPKYLDIQADPFLKKDEWEGMVDPFKFKNGTYERIRKNLSTEADIINVDEIGRTESILNCMYRLFNEKIYTEMGVNHNAPIKLVFATSNSVLPPSHAALFDRFSFFFVTEAMSDDNCDLLLEEENQISLQKDEMFTLKEFENARMLIPSIILSEDIKKIWKDICCHLRPEGVIVSDRAKRWSGRIMKASAICEGRNEVTEEDIWILRNVFARTDKQIPIVNKVMRQYVNKELDQIINLYDDYKNVYNEWKNAGKINSRLFEGQGREILDGFKKISPKSINKSEYERFMKDMRSLHQELNIASLNEMRHGTGR